MTIYLYKEYFVVSSLSCLIIYCITIDLFVVIPNAIMILFGIQIRLTRNLDFHDYSNITPIPVAERSKAKVCEKATSSLLAHYSSTTVRHFVQSFLPDLKIRTPPFLSLLVI
jgi:hypothetical protein